MRFLSLAWRNMLRNRRRAALITGAIAFGVAALVLAWALFDGANEQMIETMTSSYSGYVQVHAKGYEDDPSLDTVFSPSSILNEISRAPHVTSASARLENRALISTEQNARGIIIAGVDPERERGVTFISKKIIDGRYLRVDDKRAVMLGYTLAHTLGVKVGGEVAVVTQGMRGSIGAERYRVVGLYDTGNEMVNNMQAFTTLAAARELFGAGNEATSVAIKLDHRDAAAGVKKEISRKLGRAYEALDWQELLPSVAHTIGFHEAVAAGVMFFLFVIVALGVAITILMSVNERMREFGVMLSLGTTPWQLFRSILYEGIFIGLTGFIAGAVLGGAIVAHFAHNGMHFSDSSGMIKVMQSGTGAIYPTLSWSRVVMMAAVMFLMTIISSVFPALKTARLQPLQAMHGLAADRVIRTRERASRSSRFLLIQLALRNVRRQPMRTGLTVVAATFCLAWFILISSIAIGYFTQTIENATGTITGDAQVLQPDFKSEMKAELAFPGQELSDKVGQIPGVQAVSPRAQAQAMIGIANRSEPVLLIGVSPELEPKVTFMDKAVRSGRYLTASDTRGIVIGVKLAELLRVGLGEKVVITAQDRKGGLSSEAYVIVGLFDTGSQGHGVDRLVGYVTLPAAQRLLALGQDVTNLSIRFSQRDDAHVLSAVQRINAALGDAKLTTMSWHVLLPEVVQMRTMIKKSLIFVLTIVFIMIAIVVMNTILMSVLERTREFGIMLALGSSPRLIVQLVLIESGILGIFSTVLGMALGTTLTLLHMINGVNMKSHGLIAVPGVTNIIYPHLTTLGVFGPAIILPLVILIVALYPAVRAARLAPVRAIRHT